MDKIHNEFIPVDELPNGINVDDEEFREKFAALLTEMNFFISEQGLEKEVQVNETVLLYALVDYFIDIHRLEEFHPVPKINDYKVIAYTSFWILKRKPIQIIGKNSKYLVFINEAFVLAYILNALDNETNGNIMERPEAGLESFRQTLLYYLKYRCAHPTALELAIVSFHAGQIYQETSKDISASFTKFNEE